MRWVLSLLSLVLLPAALGAAPEGGRTWPGFRNDGSSRTVAGELPIRWSATENLAWRVTLPGYGQSSPVIWKDRVWVTWVQGAAKERNFVRCLGLRDGKALWEKEFPASQPVMDSDYVSKAAPTPAVDEERVYLLYESGDLAALSHAGEVRWQRSLTRDFGPIKGNHGLGSSPVLTRRGVVVLVAQGGENYLACFDRTSGKTVWKTDHPFAVCWSTPTLVRRGEREELIISGGGTVEAFDAETGRRLWVLPGLKGNTVASPTIAGNTAIIASSERGNSLAVRLEEQPAERVAWRLDEVTGSFASPLAVAERVYLVNRAGVAFCLDAATGKTLWDVRLPAPAWAAPMSDGSRVYFFCNDGSGVVYREAASAEKLAENRIPTDGGRIYGVAAVQGCLVYRTGREILCVGSMK